MLDAIRKALAAYSQQQEDYDAALVEVAAAERVIKAAQDMGIEDVDVTEINAALRDLAALKGAGVSFEADIETVREGFGKYQGQPRWLDYSAEHAALDRLVAEHERLREGLGRIANTFSPNWDWWVQYEEQANRLADEGYHFAADDIDTLVDGLREHEQDARALLDEVNIK